jgi:hypothetical protein
LLINQYLLAKLVPNLAAKTHAAGVGIIWRTAGDGEAADLGGCDLVLGGGVGDLVGGNCTGDDEDGDEGADELFHSRIPLKLYSQKKICLDKANGVTIRYILE